MKEQAFAVNRRKKINGFPFRYRKLADIKVGIEAEKMIARVESQRGEHGRYFFKKLFDEREGNEQIAKWRYLQKHGVRVPDLFKAVLLEDGRRFLIIQDLTEDDRYQVLSTNNPEVFFKRYIEASKRISVAVRQRVMSDMILACEAACGKYDSADENPEGIIYEFQTNAFVLAINLDDPDDALVYVADLGADVMERYKRSDSPQAILEVNLRKAGLFYVWMAGEIFQLPTDHPLAAKMNPNFVESGNEIIRHRGY